MGEDPAGLPLNLVCFDEIDALCRRRGSLSGDTSGVRDSVVNQARTENVSLFRDGCHLFVSRFTFYVGFYQNVGCNVVSSVGLGSGEYST